MDKRVDCVVCSHGTVHQWENVAIDNETIRDVSTGEHNLLWSVQLALWYTHHTLPLQRFWSIIMSQVLTCCIECSRCCPPDILHSAAVSAKGVTHCLGSGKQRLICSCRSIGHCLGLMVRFINCYYSPILLPSDSSSRPSSRGEGEGPGSVIIYQCSSGECAYNIGN